MQKKVCIMRGRPYFRRKVGRRRSLRELCPAPRILRLVPLPMRGFRQQTAERGMPSIPWIGRGH